MKGYWSGVELGPGVVQTKEDIIELQKIDADCNDCRHFKRGEMGRSPAKTGTVFFRGHCLKFDKPTIAWPMQYSGHPCFEHRRET